MTQSDSKSYFPIKIQVVKTGKERICLTPSDTPNGQAFVVLKTNVLVSSHICSI
jgi:hypothetical protein